MKKQITYLSIFLISLTTLKGQVEQQSLPSTREIINRRTSFNLDEIKVRWKKAALENCTGVPCIVTPPPPPPPSFTCGSSTITDIDNNIYSTVSIGAQCWTTTNLKVTKYNDGTAIPLDATGGSRGTSPTWPNLTTGSYTIYANESSSGTNATNYGFLYNWYASKGIVTTGSTTYKNLCPTGFHVPTDLEWSTLVIYLDATALATATGVQSSTAGTLMKSTSALWNAAIPPSPGTNTSGFTALPGGFRDSGGSFYDFRSYAFFWSATEYVNNVAWLRYLVSNYGNVSRDNDGKSFGASVRCLRD